MSEDGKDGEAGFTTSPFSDPLPPQAQPKDSAPGSQVSPTPQPIDLGGVNLSRMATQPHLGGAQTQPQVTGVVSVNTLTGSVGGESVFGVANPIEEKSFNGKQFTSGILFPVIIMTIWFISSGLGGSLFQGDNWSSNTYSAGMGDGNTTNYNTTLETVPDGWSCHGQVIYMPEGGKDWLSPQENEWYLPYWGEQVNAHAHTFTATENGTYEIRSAAQFEAYLWFYDGGFAHEDPLTNLTAANSAWQRYYWESGVDDQAVDVELVEGNNYTIVVTNLWDGPDDGHSWQINVDIEYPSGQMTNYQGEISNSLQMKLPEATGWDWSGREHISFDCWDDGVLYYSNYDESSQRWNNDHVGNFDMDTGDINIILPSPPANGTTVEVSFEKYENTESGDVGACFLILGIGILLIIGGLIAGFSMGYKWFGIGSSIGLVVVPFFLFFGCIAAFSW